jgi:hypothetical protein
MKKILAILLCILIIGLIGCQKKTEIANPASVNCVDKGGTVRIETDSEGGQIGICVLPDRTECEEWKLFRGECGINTLETKANELCGQENVEKVYTCGEYIKVVSSLLGGGSTYYKVNPDSTLNETHCPIVAPDSMSEECKQLMLGSNCVEKEIC